MKDDLVFLGHILECIRKIEAYTNDGRAAFMADTMIQDAVMRNLEIIGEATRNVSQEFRSAHPAVDWRRAIALRNALIHDYMGVNPPRVWNDVIRLIPRLKTQIAALVAASENDPEQS